MEGLGGLNFLIAVFFLSWKHNDRWYTCYDHVHYFLSYKSTDISGLERRIYCLFRQMLKKKKKIAVIFEDD